MSNWFETNATKSIILYTLAIAGATWAISTFILQDNRLNLIRSELDAQKSLSEQYKSKAELLSKDMEILRAENTEYKAWLSQSKDAIPGIMPRVTELKSYIGSLEDQLAQLKKLNPNLVIKEQLIKDIRRGTPYKDEKTGLKIEIKEISVDKKASLLIKFPDRDVNTLVTVNDGQQFKFKVGLINYVLTIARIYYIADGLDVSIHPEAPK
jgi:hypothetical protein